MKLLSFFIIFVACFACTVNAGTFKNISDTVQYWDNTKVDINGTVETYTVLDVMYPDIWQKVDAEPYTPLAVSDQDVDIPADTTVSVSVEVATSTIQIWNLGTTDILISPNESDNPYPAIIKASNTENSADYIKLSNDKTIHMLYFKNLSSTTDGQVKVRVIP